MLHVVLFIFMSELQLQQYHFTGIIPFSMHQAIVKMKDFVIFNISRSELKPNSTKFDLERLVHY